MTDHAIAPPAVTTQQQTADDAHSTIGHAFIDPDLRLVEVDRAMLAFVGKAVQQYTGHPVTEALPELAVLLLPLLQQVIATSLPIMDVAIERPAAADYQGRWLISLFPVCTRTGRILGIDLEVRQEQASTTQQPVRNQSIAQSQSQMRIGQSAHDFALVPLIMYVYDLIERRPISIEVYGDDFLGYRADELMSQGSAFFTNLLHPADAPRLASHFSRFDTADTATIFEVEWRIRSKQGQWRWYMSRDRIYATTTDGRVQQIRGAAQDITERKAIEEALRLSNERFRAALKGSPITIFNQDRDLRYTWIYDPDPAFDANFVLGKNDQQIFTRPEDIAYLEAIKRQVLKTGVGLRQEVLLWAREQEFHYDLTIEPARDQDQQIIGITGVAVDVSERQRLEQNLRESEARFRTLVEANIVGIMMVGQETIMYANDALLAIVGYTQADVQEEKLRWQDMTPAEYHALDLRAIAEIEIHGSCTPFEKEYFRKDGSRVPILIGAALLNHDPIMWVSFVVDMTTHKQVEAERTALLASEQAARSAAQEAVRVRDAFFAVAAHELRTPLTALLGQAQLLQRRLSQANNLSERDTRSLAIIVEQAQQLNSMISVLLDSTRLEQGQLRIAREPIDLPTLLQKLIAEQQQALDQHQIRCEITHEDIIVRGDALRLEQIFRNLLHNAVKYSPQGGLIEVQMTRTPEHAITTIKDQGIGIPAEALSRLFSQFYRAPNAIQYRNGLGIGLFVVKELVELHEGSVQVSSQEQQGSAFTVTLPLAVPSNV